jgi:hypothetical protein
MKEFNHYNFKYLAKPYYAKALTSAMIFKEEHPLLPKEGLSRKEMKDFMDRYPDGAFPSFDNLVLHGILKVVRKEEGTTTLEDGEKVNFKRYFYAPDRENCVKYIESFNISPDNDSTRRISKLISRRISDAREKVVKQIEAIDAYNTCLAVLSGEIDY